MSCCPPSITPDFADGGGGGGGGGGGVQSVIAGTNISVSGTATNPQINNNGVLSVTQGTNVTVSGTANNPIISSSGATPRPSFTIYVSPSGNDSTANGSLSLPFLTIQGAINFRNTLSNTVNTEIFIFAGTYTENLTVNFGNTYFYTDNSPYKDFKTVIINGTVNVDITNLTGQGSCEVCFTNLQFPSSSFITGSTANQGLNIGFNNCSISAWFLHNQNSSQSCTVQYFNCYLQHTGTEALVTSVGCNVQILRCEMLHSNATLNPIINIQNGGGGGSGSLNLQYTIIRSLTSSATAKPIIRYQNTSNSTTNNFLCYNTLTFTSSTTDTGNDKCCIQYNQTGSITVDTVAFNTFECDGAIYTGGQPYAIQKRGAGAVTFNVFGGNYGGQQAHKIDPAIVRVSNMVIAT
jgi:hypothetical protein